MLRQFPILMAMGAQLVACGVTWLLVSIVRHFEVSLVPNVLVVFHAVTAAAVGYLFSLGRWWLGVNFLFAPVLILIIKLDLPAWSYLVSLLGLVMFYSNSITKGVPLYLSGRLTLERIRDRVSVYRRPFRFLDLGCGFGGALAFLSREFSDSGFVGVENAPFVYAFAKLRCILLRNVEVRFGSIWNAQWGEFDVVYCFLSPVPMPEVWRKAKSEMKPGSLLISNTFDIPGVPPDQMIEMRDWRRSKVFIWRM